MKDQVINCTVEKSMQTSEASTMPAADAAPAFYTAVARNGCALAQYSASTEEGVIFNVLSVARNEGFKGSGLDRLIELGLVVRPVYTQPAAPQATSLTDAKIDAVFENLPGGVQGFLKTWGYRQFAREIARMAAAAQAVPVEVLTSTSADDANARYGEAYGVDWVYTAHAHPAEAVPAHVHSALADARAVLLSINRGDSQRIKVGDDVCYWQRDEWVQWAIKEVLPLVEAALAATQPAAPEDSAAKPETVNRYCGCRMCLETDVEHEPTCHRHATQAKQGGA